MPASKKVVTLKVADGVLDAIEKHAYSNLTAEVGGMLMGTVTGKTTQIDGYIPALSASAEQVTLTFTHDVWEEILKQAAKEFPDKNIVGWYHTHPTFGIFLSEYDMFIQENFFSNRGNVALVIDPVQGQFGWFAKNTNGSVDMFEEGPTKTGPKRAVDPPLDHAQKGKAGLKISLAAITGLIVGGAIGGGVVASQSPPDLSGALQTSRVETQDARDMARAVEERAEAIRQDPVLLYQVRQGDTITGLVFLFYDDFLKGRGLIVTVNDLEPGETLVPGRWLAIPGPTRVEVSPFGAAEVIESLAPSPSSGTLPDVEDETSTSNDGDSFGSENEGGDEGN